MSRRTHFPCHKHRDDTNLTDTKNTFKKIKKYRDESMAKVQYAQCADFYFTGVCESDEQKKNILPPPSRNGRALQMTVC